jgi:hypothetical protein
LDTPQSRATVRRVAEKRMAEEAIAQATKAAMVAFNEGARDAGTLYRALLVHDTWHVAADQRSHVLLWTIGEKAWMAAMLDARRPYAADGATMPMRLSHLLQNLPEDAHGVAFELGTPHAVGLEREVLTECLAWWRAGEMRGLFDGAEGDLAGTGAYPWHVRTRDGVPLVEAYGGTLAIRLFATREAADLAVAEAPIEGAGLRVAPGSEIFAHLAGRDDFDALVFDAQPLWTSGMFGPAAVMALAAGDDPRPEAHVLPARSIAEIHQFLDEQSMAAEGRSHVLEYEGDRLVATYSGDLLGRGRGRFRFEPVAERGDGAECGPGVSAILCGGKLADLLRRRMELLAGPPERGPWLRPFLEETLRWTAELLKMTPEGVDALPRAHMRSADGARFMREYSAARRRETFMAAQRRLSAMLEVEP